MDRLLYITIVFYFTTDRDPLCSDTLAIETVNDVKKKKKFIISYVITQDCLTFIIYYDYDIVFVL